MSEAAAVSSPQPLPVPSGRLLSAIFDLSPDAIALNRVSDGVFVAVNHGFFLLTGVPAGEAQGRPLAEVDIWADRAGRRELLQLLRRERQLHNVEVRFRHRSGALRSGLLSANVVELGQEALVLSVVRDVTDLAAAQAERTLLESQLRQAQKLDALGRLAGGVAHDFNNLIAVIQAATDDARRDPVASPRLRDALADVDAACGRATALTQQLVAFRKQAPAASDRVDLRALLDGLRGHLTRTVRAPAALELDIPATLPSVPGDAVQLEQVIVNLVLNARDALEGPGRIAIAVAQARPAELPRPARTSAHPFVRLTVSDTGSGMTPEVQTRLFEPFFTTKEPGKGTGLGLATVHGIVQRHRGFVVVRSAPGRGSSFDVFLPSFPDGATPPQRIPAGDSSLAAELVAANMAARRGAGADAA